MEDLLQKLSSILDSLKKEDTVEKPEVIAQLRNDIDVILNGMDVLKLKISKEVLGILGGNEIAELFGGQVTKNCIGMIDNKEMEFVNVAEESNMEDLIDYLLNVNQNQRSKLEMLVNDIVKCPKKSDDSYLKSYAVETNLESMSVENLKSLLRASIAIRFVVQNFSVNPYKIGEVYNDFIYWLGNAQFKLREQIHEEEKRIKDKNSGMFNKAKNLWNRSTPSETEVLIEGIQNQYLSREQFEIVKRMIQLVEEPKTHYVQSCNSQPYYPTVPLPQQYDYPRQNWETKKMELNTQKTRRNFVDELNKKTLKKEDAPLVFESSFTPISKLRQEEIIREEELRAEARKTERDQFNATLNSKKIEADHKEELLRQEKIRNDQKADLEFKEALEKQKREFEENYRRVQEEIEEYERETQRLLEERKRKWQDCNKALFACFMMKQLFEEKENEWATWLKSLSDSISDSTTRFKLFEKIMKNISKSGGSYEKIVEQELYHLHENTNSSYDLLFDACSTVKILGKKFPDGIFLCILHEKLVRVTNKLCKILEAIDLSLNKEQSIEFSHLFSELIPNEIPTTGQLRRESKKSSHFGFQDPRIYARASFVTIQEMEEDNRIVTSF